MSASSYTNIVKSGLWTNNPTLVQLLGMCPTMAVTSSAVNGIGMGLATLGVLTASNASVSLIRNLVSPEIRVPVFILVIAAFTTIIDLAMNAYVHELHKILGIFIPLIVTNCFVLGRAEAFASKHAVDKAALDGVMMGLGFTIALFVLGGMREILGKGTLFANAHTLFGPGAQWLEMTVIPNYDGFLFMILPPGAFIGLGLMIAFKNFLDGRTRQREAAAAPAVPALADGHG
ncbi:MAG: electron transport complex subunit E [Pseudomonadota bacterium]